MNFQAGEGIEHGGEQYAGIRLRIIYNQILAIDDPGVHETG
jgi:hypothetical protein